MTETETISGDHEQARLNADLNVWARWPDHQAVYGRWRRDSQLARTRTRMMRNQGYARSGRQRMDVFPVPDASAAPVVVFVHGGAWQSLDKDVFSFLAPALVERGIGFVALNYDLAPRHPIGRMVAEVRRALAVLSYQGARWGFDPARIFVAGHEAGGHLAVSAMYPGAATDSHLPEARVAGGLSISGIYDLEPVRLSYQRGVLGLNADDVQTLSPARNLPESAGPLLLAVGSDETEEFRRQHEAFLAAWQGAGLRGHGIELPGRHHFTALDALAEPEHPLFRALLGLVAHHGLPA